MGKCFLHGNGGGVGLNFKVVGGTTAPASPSENTIWVNTSEKITGWTFSAKEPENPGDGIVWFVTGSYGSAAFDLLKKNSVMICPVTARQYVSGGWVIVLAKSYINSKWIDWNMYLATAEGFVSELGDMVSYGSYGRGISVSQIPGSGVLLTRVSSGDSYTALLPEYAVDISNFKTMRIQTGAVTGEKLKAGLATLNNSTAAVWGSPGLITGATLQANTEHVVSIPSDAPDTAYLAFGFDYNATPSMSGEILWIILE